MTPRVLILLSLCGAVLGSVPFEGVSLSTVEECCQDGTNRGNVGHDCTNLPVFSSSHMCRIAQEQCCSAAKEKHLCFNGVIMAQGQGACEVPFFTGEPWEAKLSKICCDCCTLGLMKARDKSSCDFPLLLNVQCSDTAKECCVNKTNDNWNTESLMAQAEGNVTAEPLVYCTDLPCTHFCADNDTCGCVDGFELQDDGFSCEDIDECQADTHNCFGGLACVNTEGSFLCQKSSSCKPGYQLTADNNCQDVNECVADSSPCMPGETCLNTDGSFTCRRNTVTCGRGYHLSEDGTHCNDVDECQTGNACHGHGCVNLVGSYRCDCRKGFFLNSASKHCEDVNECMYYQGLCAHRCENTEGSYRCACGAGYQLSSDGINCEDVDECTAGPCSHNCANVYGSYWCYCHHGYQLSEADGTTCEDVDECASPSGGYPCSYRCSNVPGSYYCTCPPTGYTLGPSGQTCLDIDECSSGTHTCSASESCYNIQGGFRCLSFTCPANFHEVERGSKDDPLLFLRCMKQCHPHDFACQRDPTHLITYTSLFLPTFRDLPEPEDIIYLHTSTAFNPSPIPDATDVFFDMISSDAQSSFNVQKRAYQGMTIGVVQQVKPVVGPAELVLHLAVNYVQAGVISHCNVVFIHIYVSDDP